MTDTQTTAGMSAIDVYVGLSTDGSSWTDLSGQTLSVEVSGGERQTGSALTFTGDTPILKRGKRGVITVTIRGIYTETTSKFWNMAKTAYESATASLYARWSPGGGDSGDYGYTTSAGICKNCVYPNADVNSADPILCECVIDCATVTEAAIGTAGW